MFTYGSGVSVVWAHLAERNFESMLWASGGAFTLISAVMTFGLGSVRLGLLSAIPNLAPPLMAFGIWGLMVRQVGLGLSVIVPLTLGIVVDDTVHFVSRYLRGRREYDLDPPAAVRSAFNTVVRAMAITTVTLFAGFSVLALSGYKMNADMGLMAAMTMALALAMDWFFLPALLMKVDEGSGNATNGT